MNHSLPADRAVFAAIPTPRGGDPARSSGDARDGAGRAVPNGQPRSPSTQVLEGAGDLRRRDAQRRPAVERCAARRAANGSTIRDSGEVYSAGHPLEELKATRETQNDQRKGETDDEHGDYSSRARREEIV